jgi:aryl-alcohol dehydrogenase-like predicted oxidoreductase
LKDQISRSLKNLCVETIDAYYLHNPEFQLHHVKRAQFYKRMRDAFAYLEEAVTEGAIRFYGTATWNGYRANGLSLDRLADLAAEVGGDDHHFRFVQLPYNLGMVEAWTKPHGRYGNVLSTAEARKIVVVASSPLWAGRLSTHLPNDIGAVMPQLKTDSQRAIQFVRSTPGVCATIVGMRNVDHLVENLHVFAAPLLNASEYLAVLESIGVPPDRRTGQGA